MGLMKFLRAPRLSSTKDGKRIPEALSEPKVTNGEAGQPSKSRGASRLSNAGHHRAVTWEQSTGSAIPNLASLRKESEASSSADGRKPKSGLSVGGETPMPSLGQVSPSNRLSSDADGSESPLEPLDTSATSSTDHQASPDAYGRQQPPAKPPRSDSLKNKDVVPRFGAWHNARVDANKISAMFRERAKQQAATAAVPEDDMDGKDLPIPAAVASRVAAIAAGAGSSNKKAQKTALKPDRPSLDLQAELAAAAADMQLLLAAERKSMQRESAEADAAGDGVSTDPLPRRSGAEGLSDRGSGKITEPATFGSFGRKDADLAVGKAASRSRTVEEADDEGSGSDLQRALLLAHRKSEQPEDEEQWRQDGPAVAAKTDGAVPVFGAWDDGSMDAVDISKEFRGKAVPAKAGSAEQRQKGGGVTGWGGRRVGSGPLGSRVGSSKAERQVVGLSKTTGGASAAEGDKGGTGLRQGSSSLEGSGGDATAERVAESGGGGGAAPGGAGVSSPPEAAPAIPAFGSWRNRPVKSRDISAQFKKRRERAGAAEEEEEDTGDGGGAGLPAKMEKGDPQSASSPLPCRSTDKGGRGTDTGVDRAATVDATADASAAAAGSASNIGSSAEAAPQRAGIMGAESFSLVFKPKGAAAAQGPGGQQGVPAAASSSSPGDSAGLGSPHTADEASEGGFSRSGSTASEQADGEGEGSSARVGSPGSAQVSCLPGSRYSGLGRRGSLGRRKKVSLSRSRLEPSGSSGLEPTTSDLEQALNALAEVEGGDELLGSSPGHEAGAGRGRGQGKSMLEGPGAGSFRFSADNAEDAPTANFGAPKGSVAEVLQANSSDERPVTPTFSSPKHLPLPAGGATGALMMGTAFRREVSQGRETRLSAVWGVVEGQEPSAQGPSGIAGKSDDRKKVPMRKKMEGWPGGHQDASAAENALMALLESGVGCSSDQLGMGQGGDGRNGNVSDMLKEAKKMFNKSFK